MAHIKRVYRQESEETQFSILQQKFDELNSGPQGGGDVWHALVQPDKRASSWVCVMIAIFNTIAGNGIINIFSTQIFDGIAKMGTYSVLTTKQEVYLVGFSGFVGAVLSFWTVTMLSRRTIFAGGHFIMGGCLILSGYFVQ